MAVDKELLEKLERKYGAALRKAMEERDAEDAERVFEQLPNLDVEGETMVLFFPKRKKK